MIINNNVQAIAGVYAANQPMAMRRTQNAEPIIERDRYVPSQEGQSFRSMLQELKDADEVRANKVEYFEKAIANGEYNVSSYDIAGRMLGLGSETGDNAFGLRFN